MDEVVEVPEPVEVSEPPLVFMMALWVPVFAVVIWFMVRLFSGRWIVDPPGDPLGRSDRE